MFFLKPLVDPSNSSVELPPELCSVIMSPISAASFYSFSLAPSIMHRIESFLIAANLKRLHVDHCAENVVIPTVKVCKLVVFVGWLEFMDMNSLMLLMCVVLSSVAENWQCSDLVYIPFHVLGFGGNYY